MTCTGFAIVAFLVLVAAGRAGLAKSDGVKTIRCVMRRVRVCVVAGLLGMLLTTSLGSAAGDSHDVTLRRVPTDQAIANRLVVLRSDLPAAFKASAGGPDPSTCSYDPDLSVYLSTGQTWGNDFTRQTKSGVTSIGSEATIFKTAKDARAFFQRDAADKRSMHCVVEALAAVSARISSSRRRRLLP